MQLLSHIVQTGDLDEALEWGIQEDDFHTDEGRALFQHILSFRRDPRSKGAQMGPNVLKEIYKSFEFCHDAKMTLDAYCTLVRKNRLRVEVRAYAHEMAMAAENDEPLTAAERCMDRLKHVVSLGYSAQTDVTFHSATGRIIQSHDQEASGVDTSVARYPWGPLDAAARGIRDDDFIVFYGRPKSMKSWVLAYMIAFIYDQGKVPLIYTKEMTADNIFRRVAACIAQIPYQELRTGRLTPEERDRLIYLNDMARDLRLQQNMICLNAKDAPSGSDTVEWLQAKISKYKPNVAAVDGLYLMSDSSGGKRQKDNNRVQNISRATRQMVFETGVPVIATMQATRTAAAHKNANLDEIAFSDALAQDTTGAIRVINEEGTQTITLGMAGSREFRFRGCRIWGIPATNFSFIEELSQKELDKAKLRDDKSDQVETGIRTPSNGGGNGSSSSNFKSGLRKNEQNLLNHRINGLSPIRVPR